MAVIEQRFLDEYAYLGEKAYLDVCSVAMQPERTLRFCRMFQQEFVDTAGQICFGPYGERRDAARRELARMVSSADDEIVFTQNTTEGDCLLSRTLPMTPGDNVVLCNYDYPSVILGWYRRRKDGVEIRPVPSQNGVLRKEDILAAMNGRTRVVQLSHVQCRSGYQADLAEIGHACREKGILLAVDGIQGLGRNPVDVGAMGIDLYACGGFKGLLGVLGAGFYYCRRELLDQLEPAAFGEDNVVFDEDGLMSSTEPLPEVVLRSGCARMEAGSMNTYGIVALGTSAALLNEIGIPVICARVRELERYYRDRIRACALPLTLLGLEDPRYWSGNVCALFDESKAERLKAELSAADICATVRTPGGQGFLRIGLHYYNTEEQLERLISVLKAVL